MSLLLHLIDSGSGIEPLLNRGMTYSQIAELVNVAIRDGYISKTAKELTITEKGVDRLNTLESGKISSNAGWITPEVESRIDKIDVDDVYLPPVKHSHFS